MPRIVKRAVIALEDSTRIGGFHRQPQAAGFVTSCGFDGRTRDTGPYFDDQRSVRHYSQDSVSSPVLLPGQKGCALSHFAVLSAFAAEQGPEEDLMLVAEDDVRFSPNFRPVLEKILRHEEGLELGLLSEIEGEADSTPFAGSARRDMQLSLLARPVGPKNPLSHRFGVIGGRAWGTGLYLVSRAGARKIVSLATDDGRVWWLADDYKLFAQQAGLRIRAIRPGLCGFDGTSVIGYTDWRAESSEAGPASPLSFRERLALRTRWKRLQLVVAGTRKDLRLRRGLDRAASRSNRLGGHRSRRNGAVPEDGAFRGEDVVRRGRSVDRDGDSAVEAAGGHRVLVLAPAPAVEGSGHAGGRLLAETVRSHRAAGAQVLVGVPDTVSNRSVLAASEPVGPHLLLGSTRVRPQVRRLLQVLAHRAQSRWGGHGLGATAPVLLDFLVNPALRRALRTVEVVDLQWEQYGWLAPRVRRLAPHAVLVSTFHDVVDQRLAREAAACEDALGRTRLRVYRRVCLRRRERALRALDAVLVLSEKDRRLLPAGPGRAPVRVLGAPLSDAATPLVDAASGDCAVFVSDLHRPENLDAARWLVHGIWPRVLEHVPQARLKVVGAGLPEDDAAAFGAVQGVEATGFLEDLEEAYADARAAVAPLVQGAGVKFKLVDALVRGVPVVTTPVGAEGLGDERSWFAAVAEQEDELAEALVRAFQDPEAARRARDQVEEVRSLFGTEGFRCAHAAVVDGLREHAAPA